MIHLDPKDMDLVRKILRVFVPEGRKVFAFGSRVTGVRLKTYSDLDLCVMGNAPMTPREYSDLKDAFANSNLSIKVDVVDWAATKPNFQAIIKENCEEIAFQENRPSDKG
jgi:predicted nucleotidyltransferase